MAMTTTMTAELPRAARPVHFRQDYLPGLDPTAARISVVSMLPSERGTDLLYLAGVLGERFGGRALVYLGRGGRTVEAALADMCWRGDGVALIATIAPDERRRRAIGHAALARYAAVAAETGEFHSSWRGRAFGGPAVPVIVLGRNLSIGKALLPHAQLVEQSAERPEASGQELTRDLAHYSRVNWARVA